MQMRVRLATVLIVALIAPAGAFAAPVDPIEHELLVRIVRVGLTHDRSTKPEDAQRLVCVRDRYPGSRRVRLRCATNQDWQISAKISVSRAMDNQGSGNRGVGGNQVEGQPPLWDAGFASDVVKGMLDVSPNLLTDPIGKDDSAEASLSRIIELRAMLAIAKLPNPTAISPEETVRFARAFGMVRKTGSDETAATNAIAAAGLTLDGYNAMVTRLEQDAAFRDRVNAALLSLESPLTL